MSHASINDMPLWEIYDRTQAAAKGPYSVAQLTEMERRSQIGPQTPARHRGSPMWRTVEEVVQDPVSFSKGFTLPAAPSPPPVQAPNPSYTPRTSSAPPPARQVAPAPTPQSYAPPPPSSGSPGASAYTPGVSGNYGGGGYAAAPPPPAPSPAPRNAAANVGGFLRNTFGLALQYPRLAIALGFGLYFMVTAGLNSGRKAPYASPYKPTYSPSAPDTSPYGSSSGGSSSYAPSPLVPARPLYVRPTLTPQGRHWPATTAYLPGCPVLADGSQCQITIDNTKGGSDVHLKLSTAGSRVVRECFILKGDRMNLDELLPGSYTVSYRDLNSGGLARADPFALQQTQEGNTIYYTTMTLTLYTVPGGNTHLDPISEEQF